MILSSPIPVRPTNSPRFLEVPSFRRSRNRPRCGDHASAPDDKRRRRTPSPPRYQATVLASHPASVYKSDSHPASAVHNRPPTPPSYESHALAPAQPESPHPQRQTRPCTPPPDASSTLTNKHTRHDSLLDSDSFSFALPPSPSPSLEQQPTLRQRLIGSWRLESYITYPTPSSPVQRPKYPMTKNVTGLLMYTPDGYVSAHMQIPGQAAFSKTGTVDDHHWAEASKRCFAYAGTYYIAIDAEQVIKHAIQVCSLPVWTGDVQIRMSRFEEGGEVLELSSPEPTFIQGDLRLPVFRWRRCRDNSDGRDAPPPVPQIKISGPDEC